MGVRIAALAGLAVVLVAVFSIFRGGGGHTLRAAFDSAVQVVPGQQVRIAGRKVGSVRSVDEVDGEAVMKLGIDDGDVWPLRQGTTARLRWGSTSGYSLRYVELRPGPASAPALSDDGLLPPARTTTPVELDQMFRIFRGRGRGDLRALVGELSDTFGPRAKPLARALRDAPVGFDQLAEVLNALGADERALRTLVVAGDRTAGALAARDGQLGEVIGHAAQTFDEVAARAGAVQGALARLPLTLQTSTSTLRRLDGSIVGLQALVGELGPGAIALRRMAPAARGAFDLLRGVAPLAARTLRRGTSAAPDLTRLLRTGTPFLPRLGAALDRFAPMADCLRPYGPELAGFLSTWIGFTQTYDAQGHNARILVEAPPMLVGTTMSSHQAVQQHEGALHYAMPRPPGLNAGQPWFQPQCGAGPDALEAAKDPEAAGGAR